MENNAFVSTGIETIFSKGAVLDSSKSFRECITSFQDIGEITLVITKNRDSQLILKSIK